ncbi:hypothetical protein Cni_G23708 [Canna indica]|uniref:Maternal effect embryo arrest 60 n=1 Tax=Canna indica TaxID=4628 RepID=A0AAQ3L0U6_9LILI|nr:hypothetical protein Cni_G23708 [Canna indica]
MKRNPLLVAGHVSNSSVLISPHPHSNKSTTPLFASAALSMDDDEIYHYQSPTSTRLDEGAAVAGGSETRISITAIDGIVNVNSLFTLAVFVGLAWTPSSAGGDSGLAPPHCVAGVQVERDLISFHVFAFAAFLFSSLVALCLKQAVRLVRPHGHRRVRTARVNKALLRAGIVASAAGSVFGCGFLMLALVNVVQIKLGTLGCSGAATGAIVPLVTLIPAGMLIYSVIVLHTFTR